MTQYGLAAFAVVIAVFLLFAKAGKLNMRALLFPRPCKAMQRRRNERKRDTFNGA